MDTVYIVLFVVGGLLVLAFFVYLFLMMPSLSPKRRAEAKKYASYDYAHRGLHGDGAAENSMTAFRRAVEAGYGIELDVRLSRDGQVVVFHDNTLERVTEAEGRVDSMDYEQLSQLSLSGTEDTVPLFSDVLKLVDGKVPLLIELKEEAYKYSVTEKTLEILADYKGPYVIESFNPLALGRVKKLSPNTLRGMLAMDYKKDDKHKAFIYSLLHHFLLNVSARPDFISYCHEDTRVLPFRFLRAVFRPVLFAWTVSSPEEDKAARENGFDSLIFENYAAESEK